MEPDDRGRSEGKSGRTGHRRSWLRLAVADSLVLRRLRAATGGRLRYFCCGGPPSPSRWGVPAAAGVPVIEGYGMTEASPLLTMNRLAASGRGRLVPRSPGPSFASRPGPARSWREDRR